jgi:NDP-sugar pyrophosphorylase family protein
MVESLTVIATVGGLGTRFYPLTLDRPKALLSMCGEAILARLLESLAYQGCRDFVIATKGADNARRFKLFFKEGHVVSTARRLNPNSFRYQPNYEDKGNGDSVRYNMEYYNIRNDVLVVSGDNIIDINLMNLLEFHRSKKALLTVGLKEVGKDESISQFGVADVDKDFRIRKFVEKPKPQETPSNLINTGVYVFSPEVRDIFKKMGDRVKDIGHDVIPYLTDNNYPVYGHLIGGYWADVGNSISYLNTTQDLLHEKTGRIRLYESERVEQNFWIDHSTYGRIFKKIGNEIHLEGPVKIGVDCRLGKNVSIKSSYIGDNVIIEDGVKINKSVIMDFVNIEVGSNLNGCIVGPYSVIGKGSRIDADLPLEIMGGSSDRTPVIGEGVTIAPNSVLGPKKRVAPLKDAHRILITGNFKELGYDRNNVYFVEI